MALWVGWSITCTVLFVRGATARRAHGAPPGFEFTQNTIFLKTRRYGTDAVCVLLGWMAAPGKMGKKPPRLAEAAMRDEMLEKGALLIQFEAAAGASAADTAAWVKVQKKGFLLHDCGCLVPHANYWFVNRGNPEAASCASKALNGCVARRQQQTNELGWPLEEQYSHLCHNSSCCSPAHVVVEAAWKNRKRNYCGLSGACDCGMEPSCVLPYRKKAVQSAWVASQPRLTYDTPRLREKVEALLPGYKLRLLHPHVYKKEDEKKANRALRRRREKRQRRQAAAKQAARKRSKC